MARTIGKTMAELRRSTNEFKETWQREVSFDDEKIGAETGLNSLLQNPTTIEDSIERNENKIISPEIKEIDQEVLAQKFSKHKIQNSNRPKIENLSADKRDWL
jgi:Sec-independent protein translocase protein TatA